MFESGDFVNSAVWNIQYDLNYDIVFVFHATIKQLSGNKLVDIQGNRKNMSIQMLDESSPIEFNNDN